MRSVLGWLVLSAVLVVAGVTALLLFRGQSVTEATGPGHADASRVVPTDVSEPIEETSSAAVDRESVGGDVPMPGVQRPQPSATLVGTLTTNDPTLRGPFELALARADDGAERARTVELGDSFRVEGLPAGSYQVLLREPRPAAPATASGWASRFMTAVPLGAEVWERAVDLPPGETRLDIVLGGGVLSSCRLTGWLSECSLADLTAEYRVEYVVPGQFERAAEIAADGGFDLGLVPAGTGNVIVSCKVEGVTASWSPLSVERLDVQAGEERSIEVSAPCLAPVSARVVGLGTSTVIAGAVVQISSEEDALGSVGITLRNGKQGILPEGRYWAAATAEGYRASLRAFDVEPSEGALELVIELERADDWIVQLVDPAGRPIAAANVSIAEQDGVPIPRAIQPTATTDEAGRMAAGFLEPKHYGVRIAYGDHLYESALPLDMGTPVLVIEEIEVDAAEPR